MTIQQCKYVITVARLGSFSKAAKQLFVAQSSLSSSVKTLEEEINISIFERSTNGVNLTSEGEEFVRYASRLVDQADFVTNRYKTEDNYQRLYVSTQHYDFVADIFTDMLKDLATSSYRLALREKQTCEVIREIETSYSDVGILAVKNTDNGIMERYLTGKGLAFQPFLKAPPHVFIRKEHPLAKWKTLKDCDLRSYPYVSYEQGENSNSYFCEEIEDIFSNKHIEISDRATLMNVLLNTDCYTIGTGIMPSALNRGDIISVPFESKDYYIIGYIMRADKKVSSLVEKFIEMLNAFSY